MQGQSLEKFHDFLDRITKDNNKHIVQTCRDGFDLIYKGDRSNNPFAQEDTIEQPEPYYNPNPTNAKPISHLDDITKTMVIAIQDKFGVTIDDIHDNYILFHSNMTIPQYFSHIMSQDHWESKAYYDNDKDEYYGKVSKQYATLTNNRYSNSDSSH